MQANPEGEIDRLERELAAAKAAAAVQPAGSRPAEVVMHKIAPGDTLSSIASRYGGRARTAD